MPSLLSRLFDHLAPARRDSVRASGPEHSARLGVEPLEDRVVPALHTWTGSGGDNLWSNDRNWIEGSPRGDSSATVAFAGNTASVMDITNQSVNQISFTGTNNTITFNNALRFNIAGDNILSSGGTHTITGSSIQPSALVVRTNAGSTVIINSSISQNGLFDGIRKFGGGVLSLGGRVTVAPSSRVFEGTLEVTAGGELTASAVQLSAGTTLAGGGTILTFGGPGGRIAPGRGVSPQTLTIRSSGGFNNLMYQPTIAGPNSDRLNLGGTLGLTGAVLSVLPIAAPTAASYTLIDNDGTDAITGTFNGLPEGAALTISGQTYTISYVGGTGNDVTLTRVGGGAGGPPTALALPAAPAPAFSGAQVTGNMLVVTGASVSGGAVAVPLPVGSFALFTDVTGDGNGDVILFLPTLALVLDGQSGRLVVLDADDNGDGARDLKVFNPDGTTTRIDGRTGIALVF